MILGDMVRRLCYKDEVWVVFVGKMKICGFRAKIGQSFASKWLWGG